MAVNTRWVVLVIAVLTVAVWVVGIAGMAAITHDCHENISTSDCARGLQYEWWGLWFEFFLVIAIIVVALRDKLEANQLTLLTFLAIVTGVLMWSARSVMVVGSYASLVSTVNSHKNTAAAGFVMVCISNFLLIILLGSVGRVVSTFGGDGAGHDKAAPGVPTVSMSAGPMIAAPIYTPPPMGTNSLTSPQGNLPPGYYSKV